MAERETERTVKKRAESDPAYQWHIQDLYASDEVWEKDYEALSEQAKELAAYEGRLKEGSEVFVEYMRKKEEFYRFYRDKMLCLDAKPNAAHKKLAELEAAGKLKAVVTQNIDGLHQMAGSKNVLELHGSIHRNYCMRCGKFFDAAYVKNSEGAPKCDECGGLIKPDVVLYEEGLDENVISKTIHYISQADVLIIGGTSLVVYPAAGLIDYFKGSHLILINKSATQRDSQADLVINDKIGEVFGQL